MSNALAVNIYDYVRLMGSDISEATKVAEKKVSDPWITYMNVLSAFGFRNWINDLEGNLSINFENSPVFDLSSLKTNATEIIVSGGLSETPFKVSVLYKEFGLYDESLVGLNEEFVTNPHHFYVLMDVIEVGEGSISKPIAFLRHDQEVNNLSAYKQDNEYLIPFDIFNKELIELSSYLQCFDADRILLV
ncbi:MAG: hypothetical protein H7196_04620 [candidate division SR1 bacterium]|nr:hypothetical protein [candidate division SR1 bacterium]